MFAMHTFFLALSWRKKSKLPVAADVYEGQDKIQEGFAHGNNPD